ncbi:MAG: hypothetical protein EOR78_17540 [Mesorhizobium sp.]|uniref:hypothetical protein n=1 Tax=Mesorhizobium sp. TaxID=1871066 RepID=UPI000FE508F4|nr:hypothetical protein [Mesorhizobium sp.]RWK62302.1 MAG: hypothetical protein EOR49_14115 [Mesorhizobium sp.]RWM49010.1 MAG: hypothetical protein EOR76_11635 [Mesorhizobium sp.]RWM54397.1 MAG: hypothetical protein EOR78_17540 [Mesorhizobium sp.]RWM61620.1 MAG: hypothetical protein EOR79_04560 [Mesorhizobium sp.]TIO71283.1 MAG: hypothetical protein E5X85_02475 [Mesorhizobium sp.]
MLRVFGRVENPTKREGYRSYYDDESDEMMRQRFAHIVEPGGFLPGGRQEPGSVRTEQDFINKAADGVSKLGTFMM